MTSSFNALLSDIYRILSLYDADDFLQASRSRRVDPLLRDALRALARPARDGKLSNGRPDGGRTYAHAVEPEGAGEGPDLAAAIAKAITDTSLDRVVEIFGRNGVQFAKRPKEGKDRAAKRLAGVAHTLGTSRKRKLLDDLAQAAGGQTAGWISVLRNRAS